MKKKFLSFGCILPLLSTRNEMYLHLQNLLDPDQLAQIAQALDQAPFSDGRVTAGGVAREVKNNTQLPREHQSSLQIGGVLEQSLQKSFEFREGTLPRAVLPFLVSCYEEGMEYGWHVDSPLMYAAPVQLRADLSMTVFLNDPSDYEGGELEIMGETGPQLFKLPAGHAIIYPTTRLHRVRKIEKGKRVVAVTWIQSMVRDTQERELLFGMRHLQELLQQQRPGSQEHLISQQLHSNLLRKWAEQ